MLGYISLGSNLGDRLGFLESATTAMGQADGLSLLRVSPAIETKPVGFESVNLFLNSVAEIEWEGSPHDLLHLLQGIEASLGRRRSKPGHGYQDRVIDLDIIWLDGVTLMEPDLTIPHPRATIREFVLQPLASLNPELARALQNSGCQEAELSGSLDTTQV